jgi:hypothetical protein
MSQPLFCRCFCFFLRQGLTIAQAGLELRIFLPVSNTQLSSPVYLTPSFFFFLKKKKSTFELSYDLSLKLSWLKLRFS